MQTLTRGGVGDAAAGLGLHFLHMSEGPFSHDAGHILMNSTLNVFACAIILMKYMKMVNIQY